MLSQIQFRKQRIPCTLNHQSVTSREGKLLLGFGTNQPMMQQAERQIAKHQVPYETSDLNGMLSIIIDYQQCNNNLTFKQWI